VCEYCGCRVQPSIAEFGDEHDRVLTILPKLRQASQRGDRAAGARLAAELLEVLVPHVEREENALFPELEAAGVDGHVAWLRTEHDELEAALVPVAAGTATDEQWHALPAALDQLSQHVWSEEYDLFPASAQLLDPAAWDRVETTCDHLRTVRDQARPGHAVA